MLISEISVKASKIIGISTLVAALFCAASCDEITPDPIESESVYIASSLSLSRISSDSMGAKLLLEWKTGDVVWLGSDVSSGRIFSIKEGDIASDSSVRLDYGNLSDGASEVFAARIGKRGKSTLARQNAEIVPEYDGTLEESALFAAAAQAGSGQLSFKQIVPMVEFSLSSGKVAKLCIEVLEDVLPEKISYDFSSSMATVSGFRHSITLKDVKDGNYYFPIIDGAKVKSYNFKLYSASDSLLLEKAVEESMSPSSGRVLALGSVDKDIHGGGSEEDPDKEFRLTVPMIFNNGSANWPFVEPKGTNAKHSNAQVFHTSQGYAVFFSGIEHVLHSSNGWVTVVRTENDYLELPTFTKGRIISVKVRYGSTPANAEFVDSRGNVLKGGEQIASVSPQGEYTYEFSDTQKGEPCRMRFKTKSNVGIREVTPTYLFDSVNDSKFSNNVKSVMLDDSSNEKELSSGLGVYGTISTTDNNLSGVSCGIEYRDYYSNATPVSIPSSPDAFSYTDSAPSLSKYIFRAWAAPESGWREYSDDREVYPNSITLDFLRGGEVDRALDKSCVTKSLSGSFSYSSTDGLMVSSSGTSTYITFPAIPGKALSEILVVPATSSDAGNLIICADPSFASETKLAEGTLNILRGTALACETSSTNTSYSLVFASVGSCYNIKRIIASYIESNVPDKPDEEEPDDPTPDPIGLFDYKELNTAGHPRLLATSDDFTEIRNKISIGRTVDNAVLYDSHDCVMYYANYYLSKPLDLTYHLDASEKRLVEVSRSALLQLGSFAYAYNITGDKKFLNRAKVIISQICGFPDWHPSHFLDTAEMTLAAAIAYDWLYNSLTLDERKLLHNRIVEYGLKTCLGSYGTYYNTAGNWNQVCACGMVSGALAVYEKDKQISANVIERNVSSNKSMAKQIYYPDGNYSEGYSYWRYGTGFQVIMMNMLEGIFGHSSNLDLTPGLDKTAEYMLFMDGITGSFGYADGGSIGLAAKTGMWWFAKHTNDMSIVSNELRLLKNVGEYRQGSESRVLFSLPPIINKMNVQYDIPVRHDKDLWYGRGKQPIVMVHTGWNWNDEDHYLGIKAGTPSDGHDHMDVGSFVYEAQGQRWSTDLGKYNYADMEVEFRALGGAGQGQTSLRWDVLRLNNFGHSTISINAFDGSFIKRYVSDHNFSGTGTITEIIEKSTELGATIDMGQVLKGQVASATRTIKLVNKTDLLVVDKITALPNLDAPVLWHMITPASVQVKSDHEVLTNGGKTMYLSTISNIPVDIKYIGDEYVRPAWFVPRTWDEQESVMIAGYECTIPRGETIILTTTVSPNK